MASTSVYVGHDVRTRSLALAARMVCLGFVVALGSPLLADETDSAAIALRARDHWAYRKPQRPAVPIVQRSAWPRNPIDHFILDRLERDDLTPSPEADRATLVRRVSLDLTGLPPSLADIDAYHADELPGAYERVVDRLLASPAYGEHMARYWLDAARYADTNGYHVDAARSIWKYREWVIDAFNRNLPFDQFTIEQLAGDLLPDATRDQVIATGFHRNTMFNEEGGIDNEEFRTRAVVDRVGTTATVWLGTTLACCECHDHKYDPFTQQEFYQLYAFFNNVPERGGGTYTSRAPLVELTIPEQQQRLDKIRADLETVEGKIAAQEPEQVAALAAWEQEAADSAVPWTPLEPASYASAGGASLVSTGDQSVYVGGNKPATDVYTVTSVTDLTRITGIRLELLPDKKFPESGPGRHENGNAVLSELRLTHAPKSDPASARPVELRNPRADFSQDGWPVAAAVDDDAKTGWAIAPQVGRRHQAVFELAESVDATGGVTLTFTLDQQYGDAATIGRFRLSVTSAATPIRIRDLPDDVVAILTTAADQRTDKQKNALRAHFRSITPAYRALDDRLAALKNDEKELLKEVPTTLVMAEMDTPRMTHIHVRGDFLKKGDAVASGIPRVLARSVALPRDRSADRLAFARWLTAPDHPLVGRVTMNRMWEHHFGRGIVPTGEDFGTQGEPPAHPELLDWLATELVRTGWDLKAMHKRIVTSATYRQASRVDPALLARDPYNRLLARGPRHRMDAEMVRDNALAVSGLLTDCIGGPSVYPYQPAGLWIDIGSTGFGMERWPTSEGSDRYRRGLYTFWRRSVPYPTFATFDAPSRQVCTVQRARTNTPLQALVTLNDPAFVEAARALAERLMFDGGSDVADCTVYGFRLCTARNPTPAEHDRLNRLANQQLDHYDRNAQAAAALIAQAQQSPPAPLAPAELAAWTVVANVLLNLDETITKN